MNFNDIKCVNLSVSFVGFTTDISNGIINELNLEYGSTYSLVVSYGKPLKIKGLPYNPLKLTMENIKEGPIT